MLPLLTMAAIAARPDADQKRRSYVGCVAVRPDGAIVRSRNGSALAVSPSAHAEARILRKCGAGSHVYVARVLRDGSYANATPCARCRAALKAKGVKVIGYTIGPCEYRVEQLGG